MVRVFECFLTPFVGVLGVGAAVGFCDALRAGPAQSKQGPPTIVLQGTKSDRLPTPELLNRHSHTTSITSSKYVPLGCDPAFSEIADPLRAYIFKRCST